MTDWEREAHEEAIAEDRADQRRAFTPERPDRWGRTPDWTYVREIGAALSRGGW